MSFNINLVLADHTKEPAYSEILDYSLDEKTRAPQEFKWADAALEKLDAGIRQISRNEARLLGISALESGEDHIPILRKSRLLKTLSYEDGLLVLSKGRHAFELAGSVPREGIYAQIAPVYPVEDGTTLKMRGIIFNEDDFLGKNAQAIDPAILIGQGLGKYFNIQRGSSLHDNEYIHAHSDTALFQLASQLEEIKAFATHVRRDDTNLFRATEKRLGITFPDGAPPGMDFSQELLAEISGILLTPNSPASHRIKIPESLMDYMEGPFALDLIYRTTRGQSKKTQEENEKFTETLFSPTGGLKEKTYEDIKQFIVSCELSEKQNRPEDINLDAVDDALRDVRNVILSFKTRKLLSAQVTNTIALN